MEKVWIKGSIAALEVSQIDKQVKPCIEISYDDNGRKVHLPVDSGKHSCIVSPNLSVSKGLLKGCAFIEVEYFDKAIYFEGKCLGHVDNDIAIIGSDLFPILTKEQCIEMASLESTVADFSISANDLRHIGLEEMAVVPSFRMAFYREIMTVARQVLEGMMENNQVPVHPEPSCYAAQ